MIDKAVYKEVNLLKNILKFLEQKLLRHGCKKIIFFSKRGIYGFYSKSVPFIDFTLSLSFMRFYTVKYIS